MNQSKRQLNEDVLSNTETKKLRSKSRFLESTFDKNDRVITCIEHLSNEIFYEIFDYLDGYDIFYAFSKLNIRFNHLVNHSSLLIKISRSTSFNHISNTHYQQFVIDNRHRIISFYTYNELYMSSFNPSPMYYALFNRLESLVLEKIHYNSLLSILRNLISLPRLLSLKIDLNGRFINFTEVYSLILSLPVLKYNKLSGWGMSLILPLPCNNTSSIEHLAIDYACDVNHLFTILSYTPRLSHLTCNGLEFTGPIIREPSLNIFNLRHVFLNDCRLRFDQFEILIKKLFSQLQILRIVISSDSSYLDADRWERLILKYMPHLQILNIKYYERVLNQLTLGPYYSRLNRFISSFWIQRKWFLELKICTNLSFICSIQPLKKQSYELDDYVNFHQMVQQKCTDTSFSRLHLTIENSHHDSERYQPLEEYVYFILDLVQFTSLHIDLRQFSISILIQFLHRLPNLDSLTITSEFPEETKILSEEQNNMFRFISTHNKITKLNLEKMTELDQVHILMDLCPHMHDLQVKCRNHMDAEWLIRYILTKRNTNFIPHLCLLCIWFSKADDKMTNNLQKIIDSEKLIANYTIKRICDRIYFRWN